MIVIAPLVYSVHENQQLTLSVIHGFLWLWLLSKNNYTACALKHLLKHKVFMESRDRQGKVAAAQSPCAKVLE